MIERKIYFAFSDENGTYSQKCSEQHLLRHPYYIRATIIVDAIQYWEISSRISSLRDRFKIDPHLEIKWSDIWESRQVEKRGKKIRDARIKAISDIGYKSLMSYMEDLCKLVGDIPTLQSIISITSNSKDGKFPEQDMIGRHLNFHMQRIQMDMNKKGYAILFVDPVGDNVDRSMRQQYYDYLKNDAYINNYANIKDSLNIEMSHHSLGIQLADIVAGAFSSVLKNDHENKYQWGRDLFYNYLKPTLRTNQNGDTLGYGIILEDKRNGLVELQLGTELGIHS